MYTRLCVGGLRKTVLVKTGGGPQGKNRVQEVRGKDQEGLGVKVRTKD